MNPPNILITNYCNQNCSFCFARSEMSYTKKGQIINLNDYQKILLKLKRAGIKTIKLLGGEPSLHPKLEQILKMSFSKFDEVHFFTNGIYSEEKSKIINSFFPKLKMTFNIMTPGFMFNSKLRNIVMKRIQEYSKKTQVTLSLTIDPLTQIPDIFKTIDLKTIKNVTNYRVGFSNPIAGKQNYFNFSSFPVMGKKISELVKIIEKNSPRATISLNCGFTRCMFTKKDFISVREKIRFKGWGCFGKGGSIDITTGSEAFQCFSLSTVYRTSIKNSSINKINNEFMLKRHEDWKNIRLKTCLECPHYGYSINKCPGPCIAFLINLKLL